uniref:Gx transporter family protein n=1 Tax=Eubacterium sp. TaxID=142586 RepID=UPI004027E584
MKKTKRIALFAMFIALAFVFSYLESLVPFNIGIQGIKLGLANIVVVTAMYILSERDAFFISVVRIVLSGLTFGGVSTLIYSLAGGILSFAVMAIVKKCKKLSVTGVSVLGAIAHNIGQIAVAGAVMGTYRIVYYLPVLLVSGAVTGVVIGILSNIVISRTVGVKND